MSMKGLRVSVPPGMDAALEGLARAVLKEQPSDIYIFAADHFETLVRMRSMAAHNAGISPSSTQESNSKQAISEDGRPAPEERSVSEVPESNDTSYGVEATAVRALAASTGTVAILGTTAKTGDKNSEDGQETTTPTIAEEPEEEPTVEVHDPAGDVKGAGGSASSRPARSELEESGESVQEKVGTPPASSNETKEENHPSQSPAEVKISTPSETTNQSIIHSPEITSPANSVKESGSKNAEETFSDLVVSESPKEKEDDISKSISSERLKSNSLSNTTLSSDSIAEIENNSVKQSPSADKVVESFDSSSTVEFVDVANKGTTKGDNLLDDNKTNPARSISSDLSNKDILPVDGEKTPEAEPSPIDKEVEDLPPPPPMEVEVIESKTENNLSSTPTDLQENNKPDEPSKEILEVSQDKTDTNSSSNGKDNTVVDEISQNSEVSSNPSSSVQSIIKNDTVQEVSSLSAAEHSSPAASDDNKAETGSPLSSDNNSSLNGNGEAVNSPVTAVGLTRTPTDIESPSPKQEKSSIEKSESVTSNKDNTALELANGDHPELEVNVENPTEDAKQNTAEPLSELNGKILDDSIEKESPEPRVNGHDVDAVVESIDLNDEKVIAAATAIQASFRGFQTRQSLKTGENEAKNNSEVEAVKNDVNNVNEDPIKTASKDSILNDVDDKMIAAATTIQANFRGFQTRQSLNNKPDSGIQTSEETIASSETKTPTSLTPELIELVKEEVDEICKEAEMIAAERSESADSMMKGVDQVVVGTKVSALASVSSVQAVRGSTDRSVSEAGPDVSLDADDAKDQVFEFLLDSDEKTVNAATTIQASFRGFQARKNIQQDSSNPQPLEQEQFDSMPDYPPPVAEDEYLQSLEDLPPPDFEALESSYSEDVPTEPLAPPPPLDQDSMIFNEEDEDELMSLQKPPECDELPEHRLTVETDSSESSLSSAATKIQAGVRGYLTRKQIQVQSGTGTGTTSTSTNVLDSDQSLSVSREDDGVRSAISTEEESEVCRHRATPDATSTTSATPRPSRSAGKHMSLGSSLADLPPIRIRAPLRSALSVQGPGPDVSDEEVWGTLKEEMSEAATKIQSNFRGYRARKQLQREDAVQVTSSSSQATPSSGSVDAGRGSAASEAATPAPTPAPASASSAGTKTPRGSGEYHDIIVLTPPTTDVQAEGGGAPAQGDPSANRPADDNADMVKRRSEDEAAEAAAATKIQATYRGFKSRQEMRDEERAAAKIQAGFRGYKVRKEMKKSDRRAEEAERTERGVASDPNTEEAAAATKIQAGVRGFLVRRRNQKGQEAPQQTRLSPQ